MFLSRDRFAEKPMYYHIDKNGIAWMQISFIKNLTEKNLKKMIEIKSILSFDPKPIFKDNNTFYKDIKLLGYSGTNL